MKLNEALDISIPLLEKFGSRKGVGYDNVTKHLYGGVDKWMNALGATKDDVAEAYEQAKKLASFKKMLDGPYELVETPIKKKKGTFTFSDKDKELETNRAKIKGLYLVFANGQIRFERNKMIKADFRWIERAQAKLKSAKPALVAGDPVKSIVKLYDNAFKELLSKRED